MERATTCLRMRRVSNSTMGWEPLLAFAMPDSAVLRGALFTTYDRPDGQFLAEQLLRSVLRIDRRASAELAEHRCFLIELLDRVMELKDDITIISSTSRDEVSESPPDGATQYQWLLNLIRPLTVGRTGKAVQHAKLWMLHWACLGTNAEYLEIVVSSANLTYASFSSQLQAAWRVLVPLQTSSSEKRRSTWGILPHFLRALGEATGDAPRVARMGDLLARADCPDGVTFLASVPGRHNASVLRKTPWGVAGLSKILPPGNGSPRIFVSAPSVGDWSERAIADWAKFAGSTADRVSLVWVDQEHDWARPGRWCMTASARSALLNAGVTFAQYGAGNDHTEDDRVHEAHGLRDRRWSHAKLYALARGNSRRLVVTSANFSTAAWGRPNSDGSLHITNFELGVSIPKMQWPFAALLPFDNTDRAAVADRLPLLESGPIEWAYAEWDGAEVRIQVRCIEPKQLSALIVTRSSESSLSEWTADTDAFLLSGTVPWSAEQETPVEIVFRCGAHELRAPVFDVRADPAAVASMLTGLGEDEAQLLLDDMLFERFGSLAVNERALEGRGAPMIDTEREEENEGDDPTALGSGDSYGIAEFEWARRQLGVVDAWQMQVDQATQQRGDRHARDGRQLVAAFERRVSAELIRDKAKVAGARIALEEMRVRLKAMESTNADR